MWLGGGYFLPCKVVNLWCFSVVVFVVGGVFLLLIVGIFCEVSFFFFLGGWGGGANRTYLRGMAPWGHIGW